MTSSGGDDDSSAAASCLRSEWVTLSKAMLMVLVEKICQLSFEGEPTPTLASTPTPGFPPGLTDSGLRKSSSSSSSSTVPPEMSSHSSNNDGAEMIRMSRRHNHRLDDAHNDDDEAPETTTNDETTATTTTTTTTSSSSVPVRRKSSDDAATIEETSKDVTTQVPALAPCPASSSSERPNPHPSSSESPSSCNNRASDSPPPKTGLGTKSSWKRGCSKRLHQHRPFIGVEKREGRRRRRGKMATVVDDDVVRKPKVKGHRNADGNVQSWVACNKSLVFRMIDSALGAPDAQQMPVVTTCEVTPGASESPSGTVVTSRDVMKSSVTSSSSSLLGALLSYDDDSAAREDAPPLDAPGSNRNAAFSSSSSGGPSFRLLPPQGRRFDGRGSATVGSRSVAGIANRGALVGRKRADVGCEESVTGDVDRRRRTTMRRERFFDSDGHRSTKKKPQVIPEVGRPLWIALDKSEVCSLVDSLVSTMIKTTTTKDDDVTGQSSSSRAAVSIGNDRVVLDAGRDRHGNDATVGANTATDDHHGNGAKRCQQEHDSVQCLLAEVAEEQPEVGGASVVESDAGDDVIRRPGGRSGGDGSRWNLKWKSNMMLRLHSQKSQDGGST